MFRTFSEPLALAISHEWLSQSEPRQLGLLRLSGLSFTSLDKPFNETKESIVSDTLGDIYLSRPIKISILCIEFLNTDTLLFFADPDNSLFDEQERKWKPIIKWTNERYGLQLRPSQNLVELPRVPEESRSRLVNLLMHTSLPALIGLNHAVAASKSLLVTLACISGHLDVEEAVNLCRLEQLFQTKTWGTVEWGSVFF